MSAIPGELDPFPWREALVHAVKVVVSVALILFITGAMLAGIAYVLTAFAFYA